MEEKTLKKIILFALFILIFGLGLHFRNNNADIWWHLKTGEILIEQKELPTTDPFSFTAQDHEWILHEWLAEILLYLWYSTFGLMSLIWLKAILITSVFYISYKTMECNIYISTILIAFAGFMARFHFLIRPHLFFWLFLATILYILNKKKGYFWLPLIMLIWTNIHSSAIVGLVIIAAFLGKEFLQTKNLKNVWLGASCTIASIINPYGYKIFLFPFQVIQFKDYIKEWVPFDYSSGFFIGFIIFVICIISFTIISKKTNITEIFLILLFTYLGITSRRNVAVAMIIFLPIAAKKAQIIFGNIKRKQLIDISLILILIGSISYSTIALGAFKTNFPDRGYPSTAINLMKQHNITGNMYNHYGFGGFIIFTSWPEYKVFIDGRVDMYGTEVLYPYYAIKYAEPGWDRFIEKHNITIFLINHESKIEKILIKREGWKLIFFNELSSLYVKDIEQYKDVPSLKIIGPYEFDLLQDQDFIEKTIKEFEYLIQIDPGYSEAHKNIGIIYLLLNNKQKAKKYLKEYIDMDPNGRFIDETKEIIKEINN